MTLAAAMFFAGATAAAAGEVAEVQIKKLIYMPAEITVHVGDTVAWTNDDFVAHTATLKTASGEIVWDVPIAPGKTASLQMTQAGSLEYFCRLHPNMKATITVLQK